MSKKKEISIEEKLKDALIEVEEQPYQLPENWEWVRLGSVIELISGRDVSNTFCNSEEKGIPYVMGASNIKNGVFTAERWIENPQVISLEKDILLSVKGTIGKIYYQTEKKLNLSRQIMALRPNIKAEKFYLKHFLENSVENLKEQGNGLIPGISREIILETKFPLPPLAEQNRIVEKLDSMLGKIKEAKELIAEARETFQNRRASILDRAFRGELTEKWRAENEVGDATLLLEKINEEKMKKWEEECLEAGKNGKKKPSKPKLSSPEAMLIPEEEQLYQLPEGWQWVRLGSVYENVKTRIEPNENDIYKYIGLENLTKGGGILEIGDSKDLQSSKTLFQSGDVLYGKLRPYLNKHAQVDFDGVCSTDILCFRPYKEVMGKMLDFYLGLPRVIDYANENSQGINLPRVSEKIMNDLFFPLPPLEEQEEIVKIVESLLKAEEEVADLLDMESSIELLEKSILDKAFRGELGTGDESDEPALEMLKRII